ncbi:MAG: kelch repeat-containing protein [Planctomycetota bacterium]|nr:kelch repeat-containing protein [Planctomycetota bacterium]
MKGAFGWVAAWLLALSLPAQSVFEGNGVPGAFLANSPAVVGRSVDFEMGSTTGAANLCILTFSGGLGPTLAPVVGWVGLDLFHPFLVSQWLGLGPSGQAKLSIPLPMGVGSALSPAFYANAASLEPGLVVSVSKTVRVEWASPNAWEPVGIMQAERQNHTTTALGVGPRDNETRLLVCGGMTGTILLPEPVSSAELFEPLTRTTVGLPRMAVPRAGHQALRLPDGRVLLAGGLTAGGGVTSTCEIFDPSALAFLPAPSMSTARAGHRMTLLNDGRVLVTGGVAQWQNMASTFLQALTSAQSSAEIFDPVANQWSPLPAMQAARFGHSQTLLGDGRVLVVSGITGGQLVTPPLGATAFDAPTYTASCELFDPATETFQPTAALGSGVQPRGYHGATELPDGSVLITGGFLADAASFGAAMATSSCAVWSQSGWAVAAPLPAPAAYHTQVPVDGGAMVTGGLSGALGSLPTTAQSVFHNGLMVVPLPPVGGVGTPEPRALHTTTELPDGTFLVYGGATWPLTRSDGWVYTPN